MAGQIARRVLIGLGANLGDCRRTLGDALAWLESQRAISHVTCSPWYESPAMLPEVFEPEWDMPFTNAVAAASSKLEPEELLAALKAAESQFGRKPRGHWQPREIDLDLLNMDDVRCTSAELTLPHTGLLHRDFVLLPLRDIAPDWQHPDHPGVSLDAWIERLPAVTCRKAAP